MNNVEAECAVLGGIIYDNSYAKYISKLSIEDFTSTTNTRIFQIMQTIPTEKIDMTMVASCLMNKSYNSEAIELTTEKYRVFTESFKTYYRMVKEATAKRKLKRELLRIQSQIQNGDSIRDIKNNAMQAIQDISLPDDNKIDQSLKSIAIETYSWIEERFKNKGDTSQYTGIADYDKTTGGLFPGELTILAARPGKGKTALALQIAKEFGKKGKIVQFFSREMARTQLGVRYFSSIGRVDGKRIRTGDIQDNDWQKLGDAFAAISNLPIYIDCQSSTVPEIRSLCLERRENIGLDLIVIDYLQLLISPNKHSKREEEISEISRQIKLITNDLNIPVLCLSQLHRIPAAKRPDLSDLRESGSIEQDADNVILLHEPSDEEISDVEGPDMLEVKNQCNRNGNKFMELINAKQRNSDTGIMNLVYVPKYLEFQSLEKVR